MREIDYAMDDLHTAQAEHCAEMSRLTETLERWLHGGISELDISDMEYLVSDLECELRERLS